ncbi:hypothetical protein X772_27265 [Mesorhizobium sp. LSJC280B00]|nr:hypothetical protein X772_27265 [Mesorhizobium sp. LSJC280B00]
MLRASFLSAVTLKQILPAGLPGWRAALPEDPMPDEYNDIVIPQDHDASPLREEEYFVVCPACGQAFDIRCMAEALHHNELGHEPYDLDS